MLSSRYHEDEGVKTILNAVYNRGADHDPAYYKTLGDINVSASGEYLIFNYTNKCAYERRWNAVERACRGLIVHWPTATLVALPFAKFFNVGEMPDTQLDMLTGKTCEITRKEDGSLGILYWRNDTPYIATRGNFASEQALVATKWLREARYKVDWLDRGWTPLFEIVYPNNRVVLNYNGWHGLYLTGMRRICDGFDYDHGTLEYVASRIGCQVSGLESATTIDELLPRLATDTGVEGWVARFPNGTRVKLKTEDYMRLHRIITGLSMKMVRDAIVDSKYMDLLLSMPDEEIKNRCNHMGELINYRVGSILFDADEALAEAMRTVGLEPRANFAKYVVSKYPTLYYYVFAILDKKDARKMALKHIELDDEPTLEKDEPT